MDEKKIYINTDSFKPPKSTDDLMEGRTNTAKVQQQLGRAEVSIIIPAYNRLEKTKRCIESILQYTQGIDYELILFDNGSDDGTCEYLDNIPYDKKTVIRVTKNLGAGFGFGYIGILQLGRYIVELANDIIVTKDWLKNLLICAKSDPKIGMVCPASSNTSNLQGIPMEFKSLEEMQEKAAANNVSDPRRWEERLRLMTLVTLFKKEVLMAVGYPLSDYGFFHDFGDDDLSFRVRRMGYKIILDKDVWVHHDHTFGPDSGRDPVQFQKSLDTGRKNFREKYNGVDAWDDVNNYMTGYYEHIRKPREDRVQNILGIDVRCGTPILEIRNMLRRHGCFQAQSSAFSQDTKYEPDLQTVCDGAVACDREEFLSDYFPEEAFDYIVMDKPINCYHEPQKILMDVLSCAKRGAQIFLSLANTFSFYEYMNILGQRSVYNQNFAYNIPIDLMYGLLEKHCKIDFFLADKIDLREEQCKLLADLLMSCVPKEDFEECFLRLTTAKYLLGLEKR